MKDKENQLTVVIEKVLRDTQNCDMSIETLTDYLVGRIKDKVIPKDSVVLSREELEEKYEPSEKFMSIARELENLKQNLEDKVVLSREEYEKKKKKLQNVLELSSFQLENVVKENEKLKEQLKDKKLLTEENYNKLCHLAYFGYDDAYEKGSKETAEKILEHGKYCMPSGLREWIIETFGIEIKE